MSSSEDFIQRSLFSSLIGLRFRTPKFEHHQTPPSSSLSGSSRAHSSAPLPFNYDLPCSSKAAARQGDVQRQQIHCQYGNAVERDIEQRQQYTQQQGQQQQKPSIVQRRQDTVAIRQKQKQLDQCHIQQQQYHHEQPHQQQTDRMQFFQQNYNNNANENSYGMYENSPPPSATENISLSDQLSESLFLASPQPFDGSLAGTQLQTSPASATFEFESYGSQSHPQPQPQLHHGHIVASPHDIYQQIVNECEPFLDQRRHYQPNCHGSHPPFQLPYDGGFLTVGSYSPQPTFHPHTVNESQYLDKMGRQYDATTATDGVFANLTTVASYKTESDVSGFADSFVESAVEALASEILTGIEPIQQQQRQQQQSPHQHQRHQAHPREKVCKKLTRHPKLDALLETLSPFGNLSLEEFVKIVVAAVRDRVAAAAATAPPLQPQPATISAISPTPSPRPQPDSATTTASGETAEEILQRKRQQNNEAAARYRKRIRKARLIAEDEIEDLQRRNESLRAEIAAVGHEIDALKSKFVVAEQLPGDDKFDLKNVGNKN